MGLLGEAHIVFKATDVAFLVKEALDAGQDEIWLIRSEECNICVPPAVDTYEIRPKTIGHNPRVPLLDGKLQPLIDVLDVKEHVMRETVRSVEDGRAGEGSLFVVVMNEDCEYKLCLYIDPNDYRAEEVTYNGFDPDIGSILFMM